MTLYLALFIGILAASSASILIKFCQAPALAISSYRLALSSLFFLGAAAVKKSNPMASFKGRDLLFAMAAGLFLCLHFAAWITSLDYTSVANSVVLVSTTPIFVALGSLVLLRESISKLLAFGIALTVAGAIILGLSQPSQTPDSRLGDGLALCGALAAAGYFLCGRSLRARINTVAYVTVVYSTGALVMVLMTVALGFELTGFSNQTYLLLVAIAVVPQIIGHTSFNWALRHVSATMVAVATLGEPIGASILAYLLLRENLTAIQMIGGMLILVGVALAIRGESIRKVEG